MTLPIDDERLHMAVTVLRGAAGQARVYADEAPTAGWQEWNVDNADAFDALADWLEERGGNDVTIGFDEYVELMKGAFDDSEHTPEWGNPVRITDDDWAAQCLCSPECQEMLEGTFSFHCTHWVNGYEECCSCPEAFPADDTDVRSPRWHKTCPQVDLWGGA